MNLDKNIFALAKQIEIEAKKALYITLMGSKRSPFKGFGMQFKEFRHYIPGDDIRYMSWTVTARIQKPTLKIFEEEKDFYIYLFVDISGSMLGGFENSLKKSAVDILALLTLAGITQGNKIGLCLFSDKIEKIITPERKKSTCLKYITEVLKTNSLQRKSDFKPILNQALGQIKKRSLCFFLSDFNFGLDEKALHAFSKHHELIFFLFHPKERKHLFETFDAENNSFEIVHSKDSNVPQALLNQFKKLKHQGVLDYLTLHEKEPLHSLLRYFKQRNF